jgi:ferritin-like metal-binding protein YciE
MRPLSAENAAVDRIASGIDQPPIPKLKQRFQQHLEEARNQQERLTKVTNQTRWKTCRFQSTFAHIGFHVNYGDKKP